MNMCADVPAIVNFSQPSSSCGTKIWRSLQNSNLEKHLEFFKNRKTFRLSEKLCVSKCVGPTAIMLFRAAVRGISISIS